MWRLTRDWIAGALLLFVGILLLGERLFPDLVPVLPLVAGALILGVFLIVRSPSALVTGGALVGVGIGVLVARGGGPSIGAAGVLAGIGAGFLLAWVFGLILTIPEVRLWPLVPGVGLIVLAVVVYVLDLGKGLLDVAVKWWPLLPIAVGGVLMFGARSGEAEAVPARDGQGRRPEPQRDRDDEPAALRAAAAARIADQQRADAARAEAQRDQSREEPRPPLDPPALAT